MTVLCLDCSLNSERDGIIRERALWRGSALGSVRQITESISRIVLLADGVHGERAGVFSRLQ
jgi:hypothetical protein